MNDKTKGHCRLCAQIISLDNLISLKDDEEKCQEIIYKLTRFNVQLELDDDSILPRLVCVPCYTALQCSFDFISSVEQAQSTLNVYILALQIKKEKNVSDNENIVYDSSSSSYESDSDSVPLVTKVTPNKSAPQVKRKRITMEEKLGNLWKDFKWQCSYCDTQFPNIEELKAHSIQYHKACNPYRCTDCNRRKLRLDRFISHVRTHKIHLNFSCYKCSRTFMSVKEESRHKRVHINSKFVCFGCNTSFPNEEELTAHTTTFYRDVKAKEPRSPTCPTCGKTFKNKDSLYNHKRIHTDRPKNHICDVCGKCFFNKWDLAGHVVQHSEERPFKCDICKNGFKTARRLREHIGVHNRTKSFSCEQCGRCFRLKSQLNRHGIVHTDSLPHVCTYCNKQFRLKPLLLQHLRQHTGARPYSCSVCHRQFTNWANCNKHCKRIHGPNCKSMYTPDGISAKDLPSILPGGALAAERNVPPICPPERQVCPPDRTMCPETGDMSDGAMSILKRRLM